MRRQCCAKFLNKSLIEFFLVSLHRRYLEICMWPNSVSCNLFEIIFINCIVQTLNHTIF